MDPKKNSRTILGTQNKYSQKELVEPKNPHSGDNFHKFRTELMDQRVLYIGRVRQWENWGIKF